MNSMQARRKAKKRTYSSRYRQQSELPSSFNIKLFISLGLLLVILLMKKYDLSIGQFDVDSIYDVVYHNEDLNAIKDKVFFFETTQADNSN